MNELNPKIEYTITPPKGLVRINWLELWRFRELIYIFVWRDIKVRYKQTSLGILWAILQPFSTMVIFTIFFGQLVKISSDNTPYAIFVYSGLLFWTYFTAALTNASGCLIENESIIKKIYFPRLILPFTTTITPLIDFLIALGVLFLLMLYYHFTPGWLGILMIPVLLAISLISALGLGLLLGSINAKFRDVRYILPFFIQLMLFLTPVIYPISLVPQQFQWILFLNPMAGIITVARTSLLHTGPTNWNLLLISLAIGLALMLLGLIYFRKTERFFADIL